MNASRALIQESSHCTFDHHSSNRCNTFTGWAGEHVAYNVQEDETTCSSADSDVPKSPSPKKKGRKKKHNPQDLETT